MEDSDAMSQTPPSPPPPLGDETSPPAGPPSTPNRWWLWPAVVVVVAVIAGVAYAAGSSGGDSGDAANSAPATVSAAPTISSPTPTFSSPSAEPSITDEDLDGRPDGAECAKAAGGLLKALKEIDSRLDVGLTQADLNNFIGNARVEYDRLRPNAIPESCLRKVAVKLENALNNYVNSNNKWNSCITNFGCDVDSIDPYLQKQWAAASKNVKAAAANLQQLRGA